MNLLILISASVVSFILGARTTLNAKEATSPTNNQRLWLAFVRRMISASTNTVSSGYKLGAWQIGARRLVDLGLMEKPRKTVYGEKDGVWLAGWKHPFSEGSFLRNQKLQYKTFEKSMKKFAPIVKPFVGTTVNGKTCTLSGLLGVAHMAGEGGVKTWVDSEKVRKRFSATSDMFNKVNGMF